MFCSQKDRIENGGPAIRLTYERDGRKRTFESIYFDEDIDGLLDAFVGMLVGDTWDQEVVIKKLREYTEYMSVSSEEEDKEEKKCERCEKIKNYILGLILVNDKGELSELNKTSNMIYPATSDIYAENSKDDINKEKREAYKKGLLDAYNDIYERIRTKNDL
jgi:hypothetical protein